jgi:short-subunit dehydrogenase
MSNKDSIENFKNEYLLNGNNADIIINNAGIIQPFKNIGEIDDETIDRVMNINFFGPLRLIRLFLNDLKIKQESYIVNVSSMGGFFPFPKQTIYGASKAALKLFTEGLYSELIDTKINVMIVLPGAINTNIAQNSNVNIGDTGSYKMTSAKKAAKLIINGIKKNKFKLYVGNDSKIMNLLYNFNSKLAIKTISNKMKNL